MNTSAFRAGARILAIILIWTWALAGAQAQTVASKVFAWGYNLYGQTNVPASASNVVAVAAGGSHSLALRSNGTVVGWGNNTYSQITPPGTATNGVAVGAGSSHSILLRGDGTVVAWGYNIDGETAVPAGLSNVTAIAAGWYHNLALKNDGTVVGWGGSGTSSAGHGTPATVPPGLSNVVMIAAGGYHSLALKNDGTVVAWGWNASGQTNVPSGLANVVAVAAGGSNSLAVISDGSVVVWGDNTYGQSTVPPELSGVAAAAGGAVHYLALSSGGLVTAWGSGTTNTGVAPQYGQGIVPAGLANVTMISASRFNSIAVTNNGSLSFVRQPASLTVNPGLNAVFCALAFGPAPLAYQWQFNSNNIPGATSRFLTVTNVGPANVGSYRVVVSNLAASVTSSNALLNGVTNKPVILAQPTNQLVGLGANALFAVTAASMTPLGYQWQFNTNSIPAATNASLLVTNVQLTNAGSYLVVVSNFLGAVTSAVVALNLTNLAEPLNTTNLAWTTGGNAPWFGEGTVTHDGVAAARSGVIANSQQSTLQTTVTGPGTITFWWKVSSEAVNDYLNFAVNGVEQARISGVVDWQLQTFYIGAGTQTLQWGYTKNATVTSGLDAGWLDQVAFSPGGTPPIILTNPATQTVMAGANVIFTSSATGTPPLSYQWYFNTNTVLAGATNATLTLTNVQTVNAGSYSVTITNLYGAVTSSNAVLAVNLPVCVPAAAGLVAWWQAESNAVDNVGGNNGILSNGVAFVAGEVGQAFSFNGSNSYVQVADSPSLELTNVLTIEFWVKRQRLDQAYGDTIVEKGGDWTGGVQNYNVALNASQYGYSLAFTFAGGTRSAGMIADTNWHHCAVVARNGDVNPTVYIDGMPQAVTLSQGVTNINLYPSTRPLHIGAQLDPVTTWYYYGSAVIDELRLYNRALSSNEIVAIYNAKYEGTCLAAPSTTVPPADQAVVVGNNATFTVAATGTPRLYYQWYFNTNTVLAGATNATLTIANAQTTNAGVYSVMITNLYGAVTSSNAVLAVNLPVCVPAAAGLVAWWQAESNAVDNVGGNNGILSNGVAFVAGEVGQAFSFNGSNSYVQVADSPSLELTNVLTIEFWVKRQLLANEDYLINKGGDWTAGGLNYGVTITSSGNASYINSLTLNFAGGTRHSGQIADLNWHHCAVIATNGAADPVFYIDGVQQPISAREGAATLNLYPSTRPLQIGAQVDPASGWNYYSKALVDELGLYNRALSSNEIVAIYNAKYEGTCLVAPSFTLPLTNQAVVVGNNTTFSAGTAGTPRLYYQWYYNTNTVLAGATNATLTIANAQTTNAGTYSVTVTNLYGSVASSNVVLTVNLPVCLSAPAGMVGWWPAEGNAGDSVSTNNGSPANVTFTNGMAGQAFGFNGSSSYVKIADPAGQLSFDVRSNNFTVMLWVNLADLNERQELIIDRGSLLNPPASYDLFYDVSIGKFVAACWDGVANVEVPCVTTPATNTWYHVAMVCNAGTIMIYVNGSQEQGPPAGDGSYETLPANFGSTLNADGFRTLGRFAGSFYANYLHGALDEVQIFNRALSASEITAIYNASYAGICSLPPVILTQPANQPANLRGPASFTVVASGTPPLSYQWRFNGTNLPNGTSASLGLFNVQLTNAGNYSVVVSNSAGSVTSANAALTVLPFQFNAGPTNLHSGANGFSFLLSGIFATNAVVIDASTDLVNWLPILTNPPVTGSVQFLDSRATNWPRRFYRAQEQ